MAWTTPTEVDPGDAILASLWNTDVRGNMLAGLPILTTTERNAIVSPSTGSEIYNTTTGAYEMYTGSTWEISRPFRMQSGTVSITTSSSITTGPFNGGFFGTATVTFDSGRFSQAPIITLGVDRTNAAFAWINTAATSSSVVIGVVGENNSAHIVNWHAVQMTSAASAG